MFSFPRSAHSLRSRGAAAALVTCFLSLMALGSSAWAGEVVLRYDFALPQLSKVGDYDYVRIPGLVSTADAGLPVLPIQFAQVLLPAGEELFEVEAIPRDETSLGRDFLLKPGERQYPLSYDGSFVPEEPNPAVYQSDGLYPQSHHKLVTVQRANGFTIAVLNLFPVRYLPSTGELIYASEMELVVRTVPSSDALEATQKLLRTTDKVTRRIEGMVDNPDEIFSYRSVEPVHTGGSRALVDPADSFQYVIITVPTFQAQFESFADYKSDRGLRTKVVLLSDILAQADYTGRDNAETVRNFIIDAYQNWETEYVLLGGDHGTLPTRFLYVTAYGYSDQMPGDTYFASLDGTWNSDGDSYWGEASPEEADLYPELGVGRITSDNTSELDNSLNKLTKYETQPVVSECLDAIMAGELLWSDPTFGGDYKDEVKDGSSVHGHTSVGFPPRFNVMTLYDRDIHPSSWSKYELIDILNEGMPIVNHLGHCNTDYAMRMYNPDVDSRFTNDGVNDSYFFVYTQGCYCNNFDASSTESISERFIAVENAAFAFLGNTRYGWGAHMSTDGASQIYDRQFFDAVWGENIFAMGDANADSKADAVPLIYKEAHRWCHYQLCLLGDPALEFWTDTPGNLVVTHEVTYIIGQGDFEVQVLGGGSPVENALVCLYTDGYAKYVTGRTDAGGLIYLDPEVDDVGTLHLSVVAHDYYQYTADIDIVPASGPYVRLDSCQLSDGGLFGDGDGRIDAGERIGLVAYMHNVGSETAPDVTATLSVDCEDFRVTDSFEIFGTLIPDQIGACLDDYDFTVDSACADQTAVIFTFDITSGRETWQSRTTFVVEAPVVSLTDFVIDDSVGGDGDGDVSPGETFDLDIELTNSGHESARNLTAILETSTPFVVINIATGGTVEIPAGEALVLAGYNVTVQEACPTPTVIQFKLRVTADLGYVMNLDLDIPVGQFFDDFEQDNGWTIGAPGDDATTGIWVRADPVGTEYGGQVQPEDDHTPAPGVKCMVTGNGVPGGGVGDQDVDNGKTTFLSPVFALGTAESATISYWRWYTNDMGGSPGLDYWDVDVTGNGTDWVHLEHTQSSANNWTYKEFDLEGYVTLTDNIQLRFVASDEGDGSLVEATVDDFTLIAYTPALTGTPDSGPASGVVEKIYGLESACPNPFSSSASIAFSMASAAPVRLRIYNVQGRLVRVLHDGPMVAGRQLVTWDGKNGAGDQVAPGVYFVRMDAPGFMQVKQITLLR